MNPSHEIAQLIDQWCERRALRLLAIILHVWPPHNGTTGEVQAIWAAMRHVRAMHRDDLHRHGEHERVNAVVAALSAGLFPTGTPRNIDALAESLTQAIFGNRPPPPLL